MDAVTQSAPQRADAPRAVCPIDGRDVDVVMYSALSSLSWLGTFYDSVPVRRVMMFLGIYYLSALKHWRQTWRSVVNRSHAIRPQAICATDGSG